MSCTCAWDDHDVAINPKLLNEGEHVVVTTRTHVKVIFLPIVALLLIAFLASYLAALIGRQVEGGGLRQAAYIALLVLAAGLTLAWVIKPFLRWLSTSYTFTDRRFIQRTGIIAKEGRTIPLNRISGVDFEMGVVDRILGCGTLVVSDASEQGRVPVRDVPQVEEVQKLVAAQLHSMGQSHGAQGRRHHEDDGT